jgi:hypothetical protein
MTTQEEMPPEEPLPDESAEVIGPLPNAWHLVRYRTWEVSVDPQGMLRLPGFLRPEDVMEFCAAARAASEVGAKVRADNADRAKKFGGEGLPVGAVIVREGPPPPGAMRLPFSTIGRQKSRQPRQGR